MRKFVITLLLMGVGVVNYAQQITANSSVQECVQLLNAAAQTYAGKHPKYNYTSTISFTGGSLLKVQDWQTFTARESFNNIDWRYFERSSSGQTGDDIYVFFYFKTNDIYEEILETDTKTSLVTHKEIIDGLNSFHIVLPASKGALVKDMELAANRLAQFAKEKGQLFPPPARPKLKIKEIEGKPSYEETLKYINTYLKDGTTKDLFCNLVEYKNRSAFIGARLSGKVYLSSSYNWVNSKYGSGTTKYESFLIDLANVEEIRVVRGEGFEGGCCQFGLWFIEKGKSATPVMHLPLWKGAESQSNNQYKEEKVFKAFNHLRALLGAPEPLNF